MRTSFLLLLALALAGVSDAFAQGGDRFVGKVEVRVPERTDAGLWDGTWMYTSRDNRIVLWFRTEGGKPQVKLQYQSLASAEAFETDWSGKAVYYLSGEPATFDIALTRRDANTVRGTWNWKVEFTDSGRTEKGAFTLYRAGDGRQLVFKFDNLERIVRRRDQVKHYPMDTSWTFTKASKRLVLWDEVF